ncbi:MAG: EamA family transporter [Candidatus Adiutrix sp.]|jgi:transporter family protein|nr:EamA family transporter [Candidatus Adiutrix sp.]
MWLLYAGLAALFAALTAVLAKVGLDGVNASLGLAVRTTAALGLAWLVVLLGGAQRELPGLDRRALVFLVLSGLATGFSWLFYFQALKHGPVSKVAPVDKLSVVLTIILAAVFLGEPVGLKTALGCGLILAGLWALL